MTMDSIIDPHGDNKNKGGLFLGPNFESKDDLFEYNKIIAYLSVMSSIEDVNL